MLSNAAQMGSDTCISILTRQRQDKDENTLTKALENELSAQRGMESAMLGITLLRGKNYKWVRGEKKAGNIILVIQVKKSRGGMDEEEERESQRRG